MKSAGAYIRRGSNDGGWGVMRAACSRAFVVALALLSRPALALDPPDHERWQGGMDAAQAALASRDVVALQPAIEAVFAQAIRMRDQDPRTAQSGARLVEASQMVELHSRDELTALLERLDAMTRVPGGLSNTLSATPAMSLARILSQDRRFAEARALMHGVAERAAADLGAAHSTVRIARQHEASFAVAMGDFDGALTSLGAALDSVRSTFGSSSSEYADVLITMGRVRERRGDIQGALELGNEARALVMGPARQSTQVLVILNLAALFEDCGELMKARELYQRADVSVANVRDGEGSHIAILVQLAYLNARLGDGAAARAFTARASDIGLGVAQRFPWVYVDALFNEATIYNMAGRYDQAVASIERAASFAGSMSAAQVTAFDQRRAWAYIDAHRWERALSIGNQLLQTAVPETADYASAATIVAFASAMREQPVARTALAQKAVDIRRDLNPRREPLYELFVVAVSYAAEGRTQESAELQKQIIDSETALRGPYQVGWERLRTYAATLEKLGRSAEAAEVSARVAAESASLTAAFESSVAGPSRVFVSEQNAFGFSINLTDARWRRWSGESTGWKMAAFAAQFHTTPDVREATLVVMPVLLPEGLDRDLALAGLLAYIGHDAAVLQPWSGGNQGGFEYRLSQSPLPGRPFDYTGRVLLTERGFYLAIAAVFANSETAAQAAALAIDQVLIGQRPDPRTLGPAERELHGAILNNIGVGIADHERYDQALLALEAAKEFNLNDTLLQNVIFVNMSAGNFADVVDAVNRYPGGPAAYPKLFFVRAASQQALGNAAAAIADFRAGFAAGLRDDNSAEEYIGLLIDDGQAEAGAAFLDAYAAEQSSSNILALQALVGAQLGDDVRMQQALAALEDPAQSSLEAALVAAVVHLQEGGVGALAGFVERLSADLVSAELYALLAATQMQAKLFGEARRNVERGLALAPANPELQALEEALRGVRTDESAL